MSVLLYIAGGYVALIGLLYLLQEKLIYHPSSRMAEDPSSQGLYWEDVYFETSDGYALNGWYIPHDNSKHIVIFSHGNAGNISNRVYFLNLMHQAGISVFIYDYRGYGLSEGTPNEKGLYKDLQAARSYLINNKGYKPSQIVLFGRSLGGPVSAYVAGEKEVGGVVLESTFTSAPDLATEIYPFVPPGLARMNFSTLEYLNRINVPVLVMHSRNDEIIGYHHGEKLYEAANDPRRFEELHGGHNNNFIDSGETYFNAWKEFLSALSEGDKLQAEEAGSK